MKLRDELEHVLRAWNKYEVNRGAPPVIDFDCHPRHGVEIESATDRVAVHRALADLRTRATTESDSPILQRINAHISYLEALLGARLPLADYIRTTQGCDANGWSSDYVDMIGELARKALDDLGIKWDASTVDALEAVEEPLDPNDAPDAIRSFAGELEAGVRGIVDSQAPFDVSVEVVDLDVYWGYWLDGSGSAVRMRINTRRAQFTQVQAKQFALHEILGHGLQCASYSDRCVKSSVPWVRMTSVHSQQQVLLEGLAQALPLFVQADDIRLTARFKLGHYTELVRAELHLLINEGVSIRDCVEHARWRVPCWNDGYIADLLTDRSVNPLLRSYLWAYPAGVDWFAALARNGEPGTISSILRRAYREPLTPQDLEEAWPTGPTIGGNRIN